MSQAVSPSISQLSSSFKKSTSIDTKPNAMITQNELDIQHSMHFELDANSKVKTTQDDIQIQEIDWFAPSVQGEEQITVEIMTTNGKTIAAQYYRNYDSHDKICFKKVEIQYGGDYSRIITYELATSNHAPNCPCTRLQLMPSMFSLPVVEKGMKVFILHTTNSLYVSTAPSVSEKALYLSLSNGKVS